MIEQESSNNTSELYVGDELQIYKLKARLRAAKKSIKNQDRLLEACEMQIQRMASALRAIRDYEGNNAQVKHIASTALGEEE